MSAAMDVLCKKTLPGIAVTDEGAFTTVDTAEEELATDAEPTTALPLTTDVSIKRSDGEKERQAVL